MVINYSLNRKNNLIVIFSISIVLLQLTSWPLMWLDFTKDSVEIKQYLYYYFISIVAIVSSVFFIKFKKKLIVDRRITIYFISLLCISILNKIIYKTPDISSVVFSFIYLIVFMYMINNYKSIQLVFKLYMHIAFLFAIVIIIGDLYSLIYFDLKEYDIYLSDKVTYWFNGFAGHYNSLFTDKYYYRASFVFTEANHLAHFLILPVGYAFYKKKYFIFFILLYILLLTLSRQVLLPTIALFSLYLYYRIQPKGFFRGHKLVIIVLPLSMVILPLLYILVVTNLDNALTRLYGFSTAFVFISDSFHLFGANYQTYELYNEITFKNFNSELDDGLRIGRLNFDPIIMMMKEGFLFGFIMLLVLFKLLKDVLIVLKNINLNRHETILFGSFLLYLITSFFHAKMFSFTYLLNFALIYATSYFYLKANREN